MEDTDLEVVPERPIAEHLKECMVVRIFPHILKIWEEVSVKTTRLWRDETIVLSTSPDALLGVECTPKFATLRVGIDSAEKDGLVLSRMNTV